MKLLVLLVAAVAFASDSQTPASLPEKNNPFVLRHVDDKAPCAVSAEYGRIKNRKSDPRVAYVELNASVSGNEADFTQSCKPLTQQTEDSVVMFDRANAYLAIFHGMPQTLPCADNPAEVFLSDEA